MCEYFHHHFHYYELLHSSFLVNQIFGTLNQEMIPNNKTCIFLILIHNTNHYTLKCLFNKSGKMSSGNIGYHLGLHQKGDFFSFKKVKLVKYEQKSLVGRQS
jgi:hypothetical protein